MSVGDAGDGDTTVQMPDVLGLFFDTADSTLRNVGLVAVPRFEVVPNGDSQVGRVIDQTPTAGSEVAPGARVVIVVGEADPP